MCISVFEKLLFFSYKKIELNDLFTTALLNNQIKFVKLFLDHDFSLTDLFRHEDKLLELYNKGMVTVSRLIL